MSFGPNEYNQFSNTDLNESISVENSLIVLPCSPKPFSDTKIFTRIYPKYNDTFSDDVKKLIYVKFDNECWKFLKWTNRKYCQMSPLPGSQFSPLDKNGQKSGMLINCEFYMLVKVSVVTPKVSRYVSPYKPSQGISVSEDFFT